MAATQIKNGFNGGSDSQLLVNPDGSINVNGGGSGGDNASVGPTGNPAPVQATELGLVNPDGDLVPAQADADGALIVTSTPSGTQTITGTVVSEQAGLNSFQTSQYTIGTSPVQLTPSPLANRSSVSLRVEADSGVAIYIGPTNTVSLTNGYPLYNGDTLQMDLTPSNTIYAVSSVPGQTVAVLEIA